MVAFVKQQTAQGEERRAQILMSRDVFSKERAVTYKKSIPQTEARRQHDRRAGSVLI